MELMTKNKISEIKSTKVHALLNKEEILNDYSVAVLSRHLSLIGRREVLSGKAKFGIFGDGKEIAQIAYAKSFMNGDWRAGYYRDQTFMLAAGLLTAEEFFAQLYGNTDEKHNPSSSGRNFNNHFATKNINKDGNWTTVSKQKNSSADISPTSGQMPRLLGLAYASKLFRINEHIKQYSNLSDSGNEVAFGTIGEASTSEGLFFETINAACVLQVPLAIAVWDDGYGISVPVELQTAKASISKALKGFQIDGDSNGCEIYTCKGWDYPQLVETFEKGIIRCRKDHVPVLFHIYEMTQPLGHSTSGSHERYKSKERLKFEEEYDPIKKMKEWIVKEKIAAIETLDKIEIDATRKAKEAQRISWEKYSKVYINEKKELLNILNSNPGLAIFLKEIPGFNLLMNNNITTRKEILSLTKKIIQQLSKDRKQLAFQKKLAAWLIEYEKKSQDIYSKNLYNESKHSLVSLKYIGPVYSEKPVLTSGREILNKNFDYLFNKYPLLVTFGEDTGKIGDVNQGLKGLQQNYGDLRVTDTGIRESTIIGQGIGFALRGFRPIAEIQYLDYLLFAIQTISDDLATMHYRTNGSQVAPLIISARGHRLIGMWHSGSPMGMIINSARGVYLCVPRNMTQAAGFYNTLLEINNPAIVIEPLKAYENKELLPENLGEFKIPLGIPEIVEEGTDITIVTYGWCVAIAKEAAQNLKKFDISAEIIDVQTLIPFDINHQIINSVKKTNRLLFVDEDVPGGASAYMLQKVLEEQEAFYYLDSPPRTLTGQEHRPAYGTDGDYLSKPGSDSIFEAVYDLMHEYQPVKYPNIYFKGD